MGVTDFTNGIGEWTGKVIHFLMFWERWNLLTNIIFFGSIAVIIIIYFLFKHEVYSNSGLPSIYNISKKKRF